MQLASRVDFLGVPYRGRSILQTEGFTSDSQQILCSNSKDGQPRSLMVSTCVSCSEGNTQWRNTQWPLLANYLKVPPKC